MVGLGRSCWRAGATTVFLALAVLVAAPSQIQSAEDLDALNQQFVQLYREGKYAEAIPVAQRSLILAKRHFGPGHPDVGVALNNLALLYFARGRYAKAEARDLRTVSLLERAKARETPHVAQSLGDVAGL